MRVDLRDLLELVEIDNDLLSLIGSNRGWKLEQVLERVVDVCFGS